MYPTNLYHYTDALLTLLKQRIGEPGLDVSAQSPDQLEEHPTNTISVFLYHAREDGHRKNLPPPSGSGPVALSPLALSLYYVVTAHHYIGDDPKPDPQTEQRLMGLALQAFHDFPTISDATAIDTPILPDSLRDIGTFLTITYRPVPPEESVSFWNGDEQRIIRFSAFYEVRVALLEPKEKPASYPGYVLSIGNYIQPTGVMQLASTHSVLRFTPPGGAEVVLPASPARVAIQKLPAGVHNQLVLRGSRLFGSQLVLRSPLFPPPSNRIVVDALQNPLWNIKVTATQITCDVQEFVDVDGAPQVVLPGIYGVSVQLTTNHPLPGGLSKAIVSRSNEHAVAFTPRITTSSFFDATTVILETSPDVDLTAGDLAGEIELYVAGVLYEPVAAPAVAKQFKIEAHELTLHTHFTELTVGIYPVRLVVRGADAPPFWIEVTAP